MLGNTNKDSCRCLSDDTKTHDMLFILENPVNYVSYFCHKGKPIYGVRYVYQAKVTISYALLDFIQVQAPLPQK